MIFLRSYKIISGRVQNPLSDLLTRNPTYYTTSFMSSTNTLCFCVFACPISVAGISGVQKMVALSFRHNLHTCALDWVWLCVASNVPDDDHNKGTEQDPHLPGMHWQFERKANLYYFWPLSLEGCLLFQHGLKPIPTNSSLIKFFSTMVSRTKTGSIPQRSIWEAKSHWSVISGFNHLTNY